MRRYGTAILLSLGTHVLLIVLFWGMPLFTPLPRKATTITPVAIVTLPGPAPSSRAATPPSTKPPAKITPTRTAATKATKPSPPQTVDTPINTSPLRLDNVQLQAGAANATPSLSDAGSENGGNGTQGSNDGSAGDGSTWDTAPTVAVTVQPQFPPPLRAQGLEGDVVLGITIDPTGAVGQIDIVGSSNYVAFDQAAADAMAKTKFTPAMRSGKPIAARIRFTVRFRLKD